MDFFYTNISKEAIDNVNKVLQSGWVSEGQKVREFEAKLERQYGLMHPVATNSGTSALHLALAIAGVGVGDEVIIPPQTFVATGLVVVMQNAVPVFADIDPTTGNIAVDSIKEKISERTKAIIPVHWGGYPCDMEEINALSSEYGIAVIEDAAHALGASYKCRPIGSLSRFTAFSFQAIKHLTTGDGGLLACIMEEDCRQARARRWFGIDREASKVSALGERMYNLTDVGFKYHMNDIAASIGLGNLESAKQALSRRREIGEEYRKLLGKIPGVSLLRSESDREHAYWLFTIKIQNRESFIMKLNNHDIPASIVHGRIDRNSVFGGLREDLPGQAEFEASQVSIPIHEGMTDEDVARVVNVISTGW